MNYSIQRMFFTSLCTTLSNEIWDVENAQSEYGNT